MGLLCQILHGLHHHDHCVIHKYCHVTDFTTQYSVFGCPPFLSRVCDCRLDYSVEGGGCMPKKNYHAFAFRLYRLPCHSYPFVLISIAYLGKEAFLVLVSDLPPPMMEPT